jgi:hypothetical protein
MSVNAPSYDLWYDATSVGADLVVETWISHGPRALDSSFNPQPGDWVLVGDDEEPPCRARVTRRNDNHVWVQLELGLIAGASTGAASERH